MFQKTDSSEFAPGFLWQVVLLTVIVLSLLLFSDKLFKSGQHDIVQSPRFVLFPWVYAGGRTIENGLLAFSGKSPEALNGKNQVRALASLLVVSVLCPTIFFLRWRRRKLDSSASGELTPWTLSRVFYSICGALIFYLSVASIPMAVYGELSRNRLRDAQAANSNKDAIIDELNMMTISLSQYFVLPKEYEGGNHSYEGYKLSDNALKTAEASYVVTPNGKTVSIHAESIRFPSSWVEMEVDSLGRMGWWKYGGKFL